jgi:hypothetical protein
MLTLYFILAVGAHVRVRDKIGQRHPGRDVPGDIRGDDGKGTRPDLVPGPEAAQACGAGEGGVSVAGPGGWPGPKAAPGGGGGGQKPGGGPNPKPPGGGPSIGGGNGAWPNGGASIGGDPGGNCGPGGPLTIQAKAIAAIVPTAPMNNPARPVPITKPVEWRRSGLR